MDTSKSRFTMILPPLIEADFISSEAWRDEPVFHPVPEAVRSTLKPLNTTKAMEIDRAIGKFQCEPDFRAIGPEDPDFFSLPGKYRKIEHLHLIYSPSPDPLPPNYAVPWLEANLPRHPDPEQNQLILSASADLAFQVERSLFISNWHQLCPLAREAAYIIPPDEKWMLLWEHQGYLTFYRRNPLVSDAVEVSWPRKDGLTKDD